MQKVDSTQYRSRNKTCLIPVIQEGYVDPSSGKTRKGSGSERQLMRRHVKDSFCNAESLIFVCTGHNTARGTETAVQENSTKVSRHNDTELNVITKLLEDSYHHDHRLTDQIMWIL